jgi:hypothetical protein
LEAIQRGLFPHNHESREAQYAALGLWDALQKIPIPGEVAQPGLANKGAAHLDRILYGNFPRFSVAGVGIKQRISNWVAKGIRSPEGIEVLEAIQAEAVELEKFTKADANYLGQLISEIFMQRIQVDRSANPDLERVSVWLREEINKNDSKALGHKNRVESEVTRAVEASTAVSVAAGVTAVVDNLPIGLHGINAVLAGAGSAVIIYLSSRVLLRKRPLLPRQVGFRLYVLEVMCSFLERFFSVQVDRRVDSAIAALQRIYAAHTIDPIAMLSTGSSLPTRRGPPIGQQQSIEQTSLSPDDTLASFREAVRRLNDLGANIGDPLVQRTLMELEAALTTGRSVEDLLVAISKVIDSLYR